MTDSNGLLKKHPANVEELFHLSRELLQMQSSPLTIAQLTDAIDYPVERPSDDPTSFHTRLGEFLKRQRRSQLLTDLLKSDRSAYIETATFLNIPRKELPNREEIPLRECDPDPRRPDAAPASVLVDGLNEEGLVPDCILEKKPVEPTLLDRFLLNVIRDLYEEETGIPRSPVEGINGLLDDVRNFMLSPQGVAPVDQQRVVRDGLRTLMSRWTPFLLPFFRIVMGGIVPSYDSEDKRTGADPKWLADGIQSLRSKLPLGKENLEPGRQLGPLPYAPGLMALVGKYAISPLAGPFTLSLRSDGQLGGMVAERCIFLQESNCKGMCLNSCKLPAEQLFQELGLPCRVSPNFETQECNWAFGETPPPVAEDPTWPQGCVVGCTSRKTMKEVKRLCE